MDILTLNTDASFFYTETIFQAEILHPYCDFNLTDIKIKFPCYMIKLPYIEIEYLFNNLDHPYRVKTLLIIYKD
jgi:hypothetical protein